MAGLESITIHYLPGAERFLHGHARGLVVDIQSEGIFTSGVRISAPRQAAAGEARAVNHRQHQPRAWQCRLTTVWVVWLMCSICLAWVVVNFGLAPRAVDPPSCQGTESQMLSSKTIIFPLSADVTDLLGKTVRLATDVAFLGLSRHQRHRLLPGSADGEDTGGDQLRFERLWTGSLFNSATVPVVESLCDIVANHDTADHVWTIGLPKPEVLAREELSRLCQSTVESLQQADQAWHEARGAVGDLVLRSTSRCASLGAAFSHAEDLYTDDPPPPWGDQHTGSWPGGTSSPMGYADPIWQGWVVNITLEQLFPSGSPPLPIDKVGPAVSALQHASATALSKLVAVENTVSTWLYGIMGGDASRCNKFPLRNPFLQYLCFCTRGEPEDIRAARELIRLTSRVKGYVLLATGQADVAMQQVNETVSGWERLRSALQTVQDGNVHDPKVQAAVQVDAPNLRTDHMCAQQNSSASMVTTTRYVFEALELLGATVTAAALSADLSWQRVCEQEQVLWRESPDSGV